MRTKIVLLVAILTLIGVGVAAAASLSVTTQHLTGYRVCTLSGSTGAGTAVTDDYVDQNSVGTNNGGNVSLIVRSRVSQNTRVFIRFDLTKCTPAIASTSTVKVAQLRLYVSTATNGGATRSYEARAVSASWGETTLNWTNQPAVSSTVTATASSCCAASPPLIGWTVTSDVATFVATPANNFGWRIGDSVESGANIATTFRSRENNNNNHWDQAPQLIITYSP